MWNLKFRVKNNDSIYTVISNKHKIVDFMYPHENFEENGAIVIVGSHTVEGEEQDVKAFIKDFKAHKKTKEFIAFDNHMITQIKEEESFYKLLFAPQLFHLTPVRIEAGYEEWNVASWTREPLNELLAEIKKWKTHFEDLQVKKIVELDPHGIYFPHIRPKLPKRQRELFLFALEQGYYEQPRKVTLEFLAKSKGLAISTVQEHLRKAESKLMPFFASQL